MSWRPGREEADIVRREKHRAIHVYVSHSRRGERNVRIRYAELLGKSGSVTAADLIIQCTQHPPPPKCQWRSHVLRTADPVPLALLIRPPRLGPLSMPTLLRLPRRQNPKPIRPYTVMYTQIPAAQNRQPNPRPCPRSLTAAPDSAPRIPSL